MAKTVLCGADSAVDKAKTALTLAGWLHAVR